MTITQDRDIGILEHKTKHFLQSAYKTPWGAMYQRDCEDILKSYPVTRRKGRVHLILTSPPFPLNRKKKYCFRF